MGVDAAKAGEGGGCVTSQASDKEAWLRITVIGSVVGMLLKSPA
jgi:hypothetical protein